MKFGNLESIQCLAMVGATGLVGKEFLDLLVEHKIKVGKIKLLASSTSEGETIQVEDEEYTIEALSEDSFEGVEVAFFSVPNDITRHYTPIAARAGCLVIDDSSVFRMDKDVPLVIPEINGSLLRDFQGKVISTPNCTVTPLAMVLKPMEQFGFERIVVSTYQAVSGAGRKAYEELSSQAIALLSGSNVEPKVFPHPIAFNCLPEIGAIQENGYSDEEEKVGRELRKILGINDLKITTTAVRVPTFCGHGLSVNVEFKKDFGSPEQIRELLEQFPGVKVIDQPANHIYPTNQECIGSDYTLIGRIRRDPTRPSALNFWVITDNLRKGAALNALQIMETLYNYRRMS